SDEGQNSVIRVTATYTDTQGSQTTKKIVNTDVVDITLAFTSPATVIGTPQEGQVLTAVAGTLNDSDAAGTGWQWHAASHGGTTWNTIGGANASTYTVVENDEPNLLRVVETATDSDGGSATSDSAQNAAVTDIQLAFTSAASVSGTPQEGQVLTAVAGGLND